MPTLTILDKLISVMPPTTLVEVIEYIGDAIPIERTQRDPDLVRCMHLCCDALVALVGETEAESMLLGS